MSSSRLLLAAGCVLVAVSVASSAAAPVPVKATIRNEVAPTGSGDWFAWSKSRNRYPSPFDVWAQHGAETAFKVNPNGTQGYTGGVDGTRLVYQQIRRHGSDLRLFDLTARKTLPLGSGVNTKRWECCGTLSGDWLLFSRGLVYNAATQLVILRNLVTGEERILDTLKNTKGLLSAGQVSGNFAVWSKCNPYPRCQIFRYDILARTATPLAVPPGKVAYSPSVNALGSVFYARSNRGCGNAVELVKETIGGVVVALAALPRGGDVDVTFAATLPGRPPLELAATRVYYDRILCRRKTWDIFRVDDVERSPPP